MSSCYANVVGGIGNQLFIVAAAFAYSKKYKKDLYINPSRWNAGQGNNPETYSNNIYKNIHYGYPETLTFQYFERRFNYDEIPFHSESISINGYFQSLEYFKEVESQFIEKLQLPEIDVKWIEEKNVAVHVRRGDYMNHHHIHFVCDVKYFEKCMEMFPDHQINVFTDSPEMVQQEFSDHDFNIIQTGNEILDLTYMSLHDNMICSNSSFSWWASLLSKKKDKILVPDKWFRNFEEDYGDIYRDDFTRIEV